MLGAAKATGAANPSDAKLHCAELPRQLAERLRRALPGRLAQVCFEPELSHGRHFGPPPSSARRSAVALLLYPTAEGWHLPLTVRRAELSRHAGQISLPGGMIDPGESSEAAAARELHEELGVDAAQARMIGRLSSLYLFAGACHIEPWVAVCETRPRFVCSQGEVAELLEVSLEQLVNRDNHARHQRRVRGVTLSVPHFDVAGHHVWGATSMILGELVALLDEL